MEPNKHEKPRKRRRGLRIILILLLLLGVAAIALFCWQKNNLEAVKQFTEYTQEELEQQLQDNDQIVQDILNAALEEAKKVDQENTGAAVTPEPQQPEVPETPDVQPNTTVPTVTPEPEVPQTPQTSQPPEQTTVTPDATVPPATAPPVVTEPPPTTPPAEESPPEAPPVTPEVVPQPPQQTGPTYEEQLQAIVDKVYALREEYLIALDEMLEAAKKDYKAIPKSQRTKKAIINFVSTYISKATTLEKQCDEKMDVLIKELTQLQKKYGQSLELVDAVKYTYANEKSLKKAWYMSELEKRGMI